MLGLGLFDNVLKSCFHLRSEIDANSDAYLSDKLPSCAFCHVCVENGFSILWEDENYIAFKDHRPASKHHYLCLLDSVKSLQQSDDPLVRDMRALGDQLLDEKGVPPPMRRMGFHIPPFNSVDHLHLHVHGLPYTSFFQAARYPIVSGEGSNSKGYSWFVEVGQAIDILERGRSVNVMPS
ncbi:hypothetical protein AMATHDRAFT_143355 [Amanita thiersii Skay4041]|uniref:HIT domain-containing protein n=1 Tax=Amanita thiersii Skay4041 TaxID=703135 RepID=A0A2A9NTJ5_9AGAR|nr:hypothetical protein AMATHDRAFT_143355 [Amanita thiersii Skay4041]